MEGLCGRAVCGFACALEQYYLHPSSKMPEEIALAVETMGSCPHASELADKYKKELEVSKAALRKMREKK